MIFKILYTIHERSTGERGAVAAEYAVLLALIAVALVTIIEGLTGGITTAFGRAIDVLNDAPAPA